MRRLLLLAAALLSSTPLAAQTLVIGNKGEDTVSFVDLATGRERVRTPTASQPHEVAISPDGRRAAVVAYGGNTIDLFDVATGARLERIDLGANRRPHGLIWRADGHLVATAEGSDTLAVVRVDGSGPGRVRAVPTTQAGSHMLALKGDTAWVANMKSGTVGVVDLAGRRPVRLLAAGKEPEGIALSPDGRRLWVADRGAAEVRIFDTATHQELGRVGVGEMPIRILVTPNGRQAIVSNHRAGTLSVVDARTMRLARTIRVSGDPAAAQVTIMFGRTPDRLFVAETGPNTIAEVDLRSGRVLRRLPAGADGDGLGLSPVTG